MTAQTEKCRSGVRPPAPASEPHPAKEGNSVSHDTPPHPRWCSSSWRCVALDDTVIHRSEPRTVQTADGEVTVGWFRIDVDNLPGTVRLEVLPDPPVKQVAA